MGFTGGCEGGRVGNFLEFFFVAVNRTHGDLEWEDVLVMVGIGGHLLHIHYILPFTIMNNVQKYEHVWYSHLRHLK